MAVKSRLLPAMQKDSRYMLSEENQDAERGR